MSQPDGTNNPYGQPPAYGTPQGYLPAEHPQSQTTFILGIVGIFVGICAFIAWYMGGKAKKEIQAGAPYPWDGKIKTGYLLGKIFGIIYIVGIALYIVVAVLLVAVMGASQY